MKQLLQFNQLISKSVLENVTVCTGMKSINCAGSASYSTVDIHYF